MKVSRTKARNGLALWNVLAHPVFTNVVRAFVVIVLALGGYIWNAEIAHLNQSVQALQHQVDVNLTRQWQQMNEVRRDLTEVQRDVQGVVLRTNEHLLKLLADRNGTP